MKLQHSLLNKRCGNYSVQWNAESFQAEFIFTDYRQMHFWNEEIDFDEIIIFTVDKLNKRSISLCPENSYFCPAFLKNVMHKEKFLFASPAGKNITGDIRFLNDGNPKPVIIICLVLWHLRIECIRSSVKNLRAKFASVVFNFHTMASTSDLTG